MREQRVRLDAFEAAQKRQVEEAREADERKRQAQERGKAAEDEIRDAGDRYRVALGQHYDVMDPYSSLARAAMAEYGEFIRDREQRTQQIAKEQDPEARQALELRKQIEASDYMAITSHRIAGQSEVITGRRDSEEAVRFRERATEYEAQSKELRQEYRDLATERAARAADPQERQERQEQDRNVRNVRNVRSRGRRRNGRNGRGRNPVQRTANQPSPRRTAPQRKPKRATATRLRSEITDSKAERIAKIIERAGSSSAPSRNDRTAKPATAGGRSR